MRLNPCVLKSCLQAAVLLLCLQGGGAYGESTPMVNWASLNLTPDQGAEIERLESQWQRVYGEISPQLAQDKAALRRLLRQAQCNEEAIHQLQTRIHGHEERLRSEALRIFMGKKNRLTPPQRNRLQEMMDGSQ